MKEREKEVWTTYSKMLMTALDCTKIQNNCLSLDLRLLLSSLWCSVLLPKQIFIFIMFMIRKKYKLFSSLKIKSNKHSSPIPYSPIMNPQTKFFWWLKPHSCSGRCFRVICCRPSAIICLFYNLIAPVTQGYNKIGVLIHWSWRKTNYPGERASPELSHL